ncbi:hypothetical protein BJF79_19100 [Actinomadura sp. CNU-125]|uniref:hypothetical protein n=1 Tax=Actinomadura sp. CNU-125 TaxID=1904961 RepID=UPI00095E65F1|nr:hypothetical protein [Actinomadura sp. CNU-125]OLT14257.1 hypothetical protein BJF79_19100 [Actinomadura sp. CNU-125]
MRRSLRLVLIGIPVLIIALWGAYTGVIAYTFAAGEKATASVESCGVGGTTNGRRSSGSCHGTWRTEGGETGRGQIYNLNVREAAGETVQVRIGPLGPYANGWERAWIMPVVSGGFILLALIAYIVILRWKKVFHRLKLAESITDEPDGLIVTDAGVRRPDGTPHALVRRLEGPPPGHERLDLPGRTERHDELAGPGRTVFQSVLDADERPLMILEHRSDRKLHPETVLLDTSGAPAMLVRRVGDMEFRLLDPAGAELGSARPPGRARVQTLEVRDAGGTPVAVAVGKRNEWLLRIEVDAPAPLRDAALVLALVQTRTAY